MPNQQPAATPVVAPDTPVEARVNSAHDEFQVISDGLDLAGYRSTNESPYVADYFGLRDLYRMNPEVQTMVDSITEHLIGKSEGQSLVYIVKDMLDQYHDEMNLQDNDSGIYQLKKVLELVEIKQRIADLDNLKAQAIADIDKMV